jgi:heme exporter protein D
VERFLPRAGSALAWAGVVVLGSFGVVFTFANYPALGIGELVLLVLLAVYSGWKRRDRLARAERARKRERDRLQ